MERNCPDTGAARRTRRAAALFCAMIAAQPVQSAPPAPPLSAAPLSAPSLSAAPVLADNSAEMRVLRVGRRLAQAAAAECPDQILPAPLLLHDLTSYPASERSAVAAAAGLGDGFGVRGVAAGPLQPGDEIVDAPDTFRLPLARSSARRGSNQRVADFEDRLARALASGPVTLNVRRSGADQAVVVAPERGCATRTALVAGGVPDAWSDGRTIAVTSALAAMADDDELAFVLGHELAHILAGDGKGNRWLPSLGIGANRAREREIAADRRGALLARRAGFAPQAATRFLTRLARLRDLDHAASHPDSAARIAAIEAALADER